MQKRDRTPAMEEVLISKQDLREAGFTGDEINHHKCVSDPRLLQCVPKAIRTAMGIGCYINPDLHNTSEMPKQRLRFLYANKKCSPAERKLVYEPVSCPTDTGNGDIIFNGVWGNSNQWLSVVNGNVSFPCKRFGSRVNATTPYTGDSRVLGDTFVNDAEELERNNMLHYSRTLETPIINGAIGPQFIVGHILDGGMYLSVRREERFEQIMHRSDSLIKDCQTTMNETGNDPERLVVEWNGSSIGNTVLGISAQARLKCKRQN